MENVPGCGEASWGTGDCEGTDHGCGVLVWRRGDCVGAYKVSSQEGWRVPRPLESLCLHLHKRSRICLLGELSELPPLPRALNGNRGQPHTGYSSTPELGGGEVHPQRAQCLTLSSAGTGPINEQTKVNILHSITLDK